MSEQPQGFQVTLDVSTYRPEEITVKTDDRFVIIIGEQEEWLPDKGYIANHFIRRYFLPDNIETSALQSNISQEGLLTVAAPIKNLAIKDKPGKS